MSKVGRLPIAIPAGVTVAVSADNVVSVKGPKGEPAKAMNKDMGMAVEDDQVVVTRPSDQREHRALHGLTRALVSNMMIGAEKEFGKSLELIGAGYRAQLQSRKLVMNLGYSHPVEIEPIEDVTFETPVVTKVVVRGIDKERIGATTVDIRSWRKPEPYKGKEIKYDNEVIRRREGKTGKK